MREILRNYLRNKGVGRFPAFLSPATGCTGGLDKAFVFWSKRGVLTMTHLSNLDGEGKNGKKQEDTRHK